MKFENLDCKSYYPELFSFYSILLLHDLNGKTLFDDTPVGCSGARLRGPVRPFFSHAAAAI
jgi:hypothetical protein